MTPLAEDLRLRDPSNRLGLGGEGPVLRTVGNDVAAAELLQAALASGLRFFDTASAYSDSERYLGQALASVRDEVLLASKSAGRTRRSARADLELSLQRLCTDYLDIWHVHDIRTLDQWAEVSRRGGALEAFTEARNTGRVRGIGLAVHRDPWLVAKALGEYPFDVVMVPVNPLEDSERGFLPIAVPAAQQAGVPVIGMFVLAQGRLPGLGLRAGHLVRWALAQPVALLAVGCATVAQLRENLASARAGPLSRADVDGISWALAPFADGLAFYRQG